MIDHINGDTFTAGSSSYAAVSGYPNITVPAGFASAVPLGISFIGAPFAEQTLIEIAGHPGPQTAAVLIAGRRQTGHRISPDCPAGRENATPAAAPASALRFDCG